MESAGHAVKRAGKRVKHAEPEVTESDSITRCTWCTADPIYITYHDEQWGRPLHGDDVLFGMLSLEGQQAGLSWLTILKRRGDYDAAFHGFNVEKVARMTSKDIDDIIADGKVIRHRGKLESIINNAQRTIELRKETGKSFDDFVWSFKPKSPRTPVGEALVPEAIQFHEALKIRGFRFAGPTICHAFFQAVGLLVDHDESCTFYEKHL